jgi:hypothetical protein
MSTRPLSLFAKPQEDSRLAKNILALYDENSSNKHRTDDRPLSYREENASIHPENNSSPPKGRPSSANPLKRRLKTPTAGANRAKEALKPASTNHKIVEVNRHAVKEDLIEELYELKKKNLGYEEHINHLKTENYRLESEASKQQRRIDQLLNLSEGVKAISSNSAQQLRKEIEKSILVRQLKSQINLLKNVIADKELEIDSLKRDIRVTHIREVENERDEYSIEIPRLLKVIENLKAELSRERRRREWNCKLAGETGDDLRKELARLASGYQSILTNLSHRGVNGLTAEEKALIPTDKVNPYHISGRNGRPLSAGVARRPSADNTNTKVNEQNRQRPQSAGFRGKDNSNPRPVTNNPSDNSPRDTWIESFNFEYFNNHTNPVISPLSHNDNGTSNHTFESFHDDNSNLGNHTDATQQQSDPQPVSTYHPSDNENENVIVPSLNLADLSLNNKLHEYHKIDEKELLLHHQPHPIPASHTTFVPAPSAMPVPRPVINHIMSNSSMNSSFHIENPFGQGDRIQAEYRGKGRWYDGQVKSFEKENGTYTIVYDDDDEEKGVLPIRVRLISKARPESKFQIGNNVEALYYSGKTWYKGEIKAAPVYSDVKSSYVYDIVYEDGEKEKQVLEQNIRLIDPPPTAPAVVSAPTPAPVTLADNQNRSQDISPRNPSAVSSPRPTAPTVNAPKFKKDDRTEGRYSGNNEWYSATVSAVHSSTAGEYVYSLLYDDGDTEENVTENNIRHKYVENDNMSHNDHNATTVPDEQRSNQSAPKSSSVAVASSSSTSFKVGDTVEAYFEQYSNWFRGVITDVDNVSYPASYHIKYDDGDEEKNVTVNRIRPFQKYQGAVEFKYRVKDKVEARYQNGIEWFKGRILAPHSDEDYGPVYDVLYEDGDEESKIKEVNIRLIAAASPRDKGESAISLPFKLENRIDFNNESTGAMNNEVRQQKESPNKSLPSHNHGTSSQRVITTNLDAFLNDLSDDEDDIGLDAGKPVTLKSTIQGEVVIQQDQSELGEEYNDEFDA